MNRGARVLFVATLACISLSPRAANADDEEKRREPDVSRRRFGLGTLFYQARYARSVDPVDTGGFSSAVAFGLGARALVGKRFGWAPGIGLELGASYRGGFLYGFELLPLGAGVAIGRTGFFALSTGAGFDGITARVPFGVKFPVEARLEIDLSTDVRLNLDARAIWGPGPKARDGGSPTFSFCDAVDSGVSIRFGRSFYNRRSAASRGYFVGFRYGEMMGTSILGVVIGHEIAFGG